jgi:hypothetical protein
MSKNAQDKLFKTFFAEQQQTAAPLMSDLAWGREQGWGAIGQVA